MLMETSLLPSPLISIEKGMDEGSSREGKPASKAWLFTKLQG